MKKMYKVVKARNVGRGLEGSGMLAELHLNGKKVADVKDDGNGAGPMAYFDGGWKGKDAQEWQAYLKTLPKWQLPDHPELGSFEHDTMTALAMLIEKAC